jgi:hypothetical protein
MTTATRWLLYPVIGAMAVTAVSGMVGVAPTAGRTSSAVPGASHAVGGHPQHLEPAMPTVARLAGWRLVAPAASSPAPR